MECLMICGKSTQTWNKMSHRDNSIRIKEADLIRQSRAAMQKVHLIIKVMVSPLMTSARTTAF
jgi:hypothetical protein